MIDRIKFVTLALLWPAAMMAAELPKADFFVAADGSDTNPGTATEPFATIGRAQRAVRSKIAAGLDADVLVLIRGGTYELAEPLMFGPEDSGTEKFSITYAAYPGETVLISGGRKITGWTKAKGPVWTTELPEVKEGRWYFRQLVVNGRRAVRARMPDADANPPYLKLTEAKLSDDNREYKFGFAVNTVKNWNNLNDVEVIVLKVWAGIRKFIQSVDEEQGTVVLQPPHVRVGWHSAQPGCRAYFENAQEFLDRPGEWYLNRKTGTLSYIPRPGENMAQAEAIAPRLTSLMEVRGTEQRPVRNLHFRGLRFAHADHVLPPHGFDHSQAGSAYGGRELYPEIDDRHLKAALEWRFAEHCSFTDGAVEHVQGSGLAFLQGCHRNVIEGNLLRFIGGNAVNLGARQDYPEQPNMIPQHNRIANNLIDNCADVHWGTVGIWVGFAAHTTVAHNEVRNLPYTGISVGWKWDEKPSSSKANVIENNYIHHVLGALHDGGGIYTLGFQPDSVIRGNVIHDVLVSSMNGGLFLDQGTSGFLIENNVVYCWEPVRKNNAPAEQPLAENNVLKQTQESGIPAKYLGQAGLQPRYRKLLAER